MITGGYVSMRHNNIRDLEASMLREVCKDVKVEPEFLPMVTLTPRAQMLLTRPDLTSLLLVCGAQWKEPSLMLEFFTPTQRHMPTHPHSNCTSVTKKKRSVHIMTECFKWRKDPSHPLFSQQLVGWVLNPQGTTRG